jgi:hypothetical protein
MSANSAPTSKKYFSLQLVLLCALPLIVLILWIVALSSLATAGGTATAEAPARISVPIPAAAKTVVMLEMSIAVTRKAPAAHLGAVVRVRLQAVLRWRSAAFRLAKTRSYQFNVARALGQSPGGTAEVEVSVIDRGGGPPPSGAALSIGRAQIVTR